MKTRPIVAAIAAASLVLSSGTFAQSADQNQEETRRNAQIQEQMRRDAERQEQVQRDAQRADPRSNPRGGDARAPGRVEPRRDGRADPGAGYRADPRAGYRGDSRDNYRGDDRYRGVAGGYSRGDDGYRADRWRHEGRGAGPNHAFYRGGRLPSEYRDRSYVVDDWRGHRLYAPPRGYQWVQTGGDYVLVALATGIIAAILLNQ